MNCYGCQKHRPLANSLVIAHVQSGLIPDTLRFDAILEVASTGLVSLGRRVLIVEDGRPSMFSRSPLAPWKIYERN